MDWMTYLQTHIDEPMWPFAVLDHCAREGVATYGSADAYLDWLIDEVCHYGDTVAITRSLLMIAVSLIGGDFVTVLGKVRRFLEKRQPLPDQEDVEVLASEFGRYGHRLEFERMLDSIRRSREEMVDMGAPSDMNRIAIKPQENLDIRVFVSYSHNDKVYVGDSGVSLLKFLRGLERYGISFWWDRRLRGSDLWDDIIKEEMQKADIALVMVSQYFLDSPYCRNTEAVTFIERREKEGLKIFPVRLSKCDLSEEGWIKATQIVPREGRTLDYVRGRAAARTEVYADIWEDLLSVARDIAMSRKKASG
jgi:hypothetical protein